MHIQHSVHIQYKSITFFFTLTFSKRRKIYRHDAVSKVKDIKYKIYTLERGQETRSNECLLHAKSSPKSPAGRLLEKTKEMLTLLFNLSDVRYIELVARMGVIPRDYCEYSSKLSIICYICSLNCTLGSQSLRW